MMDTENEVDADTRTAVLDARLDALRRDVDRLIRLASWALGANLTTMLTLIFVAYRLIE